MYLDQHAEDRTFHFDAYGAPELLIDTLSTLDPTRFTLTLRITGRRRWSFSAATVWGIDTRDGVSESKLDFESRQALPDWMESALVLMLAKAERDYVR